MRVGGADAEITPSMQYSFASDKTLSVEVLSELRTGEREGGCQVSGLFPTPLLFTWVKVFSAVLSIILTQLQDKHAGKQIMRMAGKQLTKKI